MWQVYQANFFCKLYFEYGVLMFALREINVLYKCKVDLFTSL